MSSRSTSRLGRLLSRLGAILLLIPLILGLFTNLASAQTDPQTVTDDEVNVIAKELFCPVCESTPLDVCPTQACADWREIIRVKLSQGETEQQIKDYFVNQYGPRALAEPPQEGFTLAVWIIPIAAVLVGGFFFSRYLRGINTNVSVSADPAQDQPREVLSDDPAPDQYTARIEHEIRERGK